MNIALLTNPVVLLFVLWGASALFRRYIMGDGDSPAASGGIVMAGGIFVIAALEELDRSELVARLVVLELLVIWGYIAFSYLRSALRGDLGSYVRQPANTFPIGTWVAGTAVLARAMEEVIESWRPLEIALWLVAVALWVWYLRMLPAAFRGAADLSGGYQANGAVLLSAVAAQSIVVSGAEVLPGGMPLWISTGIITLGYLFYAAGFVLIARRYLRTEWSLADNWDDTNCILHGAMSISGLAALQSEVVPDGWIIATWAWVVAMFVLVEGVEVVRAFFRVRAYGREDGLFTYYVSQWARNFTFGMFYAFTLQLYNEGPALGPAWVEALQQAIVSYGQYVVLAVLLAESGLFLWAKVHSGPFFAKRAASS